MNACQVKVIEGIVSGRDMLVIFPRGECQSFSWPFLCSAIRRSSYRFCSNYSTMFGTIPVCL